MSSKRQILSGGRLLRTAARPKAAPSSSKCLFCTAPRSPPRSSRSLLTRHYSTSTVQPINARAELEQTLLRLGDTAPEFVNLARLQLALQGLRQNPGEEVVRVAILWAEDGNTPRTAKDLLRVLLADPLVDRQAWEEELESYDASEPLIVRVTPQSHGHQEGVITVAKDDGLKALHVSSAALNALNLELILTSSSLPLVGSVGISIEDAIYAPPVGVQLDDDRTMPVPTPVHRTILVADGFQGAVALSTLGLPTLEDGAFIPAVNLPGLTKDQLETGLHNIDVSQAEKAIELFRQGPQHAMQYERHWTASNVSSLVKWLREGANASPSSTKPVVRSLITSLLQRTAAEVEAEEARKTSRALAIKNLPQARELNDAVSVWAQEAHAELQGELDLAFTGRRWRKLGWWKLYWRVDDVGMLTNEMLSQRFLPTAEQELVYLTGRIAGPSGDHHEYSQPRAVRNDGTKVDQTSRKLGSGETAPALSALPKWPGHISFTRRYLQNETIPALQALAQRLVIQSLGTSGVTTSLAALLYVSSFASTLYEAGAVAALGIVYSLGRMQKKWETARSFWEGEVREEGRKAVRGTEESVSEALRGVPGSLPVSDESHIQKTRELIGKAEDALARMK